jgi:hypothetical protein
MGVMAFAIHDAPTRERKLGRACGILLTVLTLGVMVGRYAELVTCSTGECQAMGWFEIFFLFFTPWGFALVAFGLGRFAYRRWGEDALRGFAAGGAMGAMLMIYGIATLTSAGFS